MNCARNPSPGALCSAVQSRAECARLPGPSRRTIGANMQPALRSPIPDATLAVFAVNGGKPHQGVRRENPALYLRHGVQNSTTALGMRGQAELNRIGSCCTGKERDAESGNDYFEARYYASSMGRFLSPDWSAQEEPVPYAHLDDPQSLNLYAYVRNNPLSRTDADGHGCPESCPFPLSLFFNTGLPEQQESNQLLFKQAADSPYVEGGGQIALGVGLVATAATGDVPGGVAGALLVTNATLGGTATAVSGTTQIIGAATNTDTTAAQDALSATSSLPGLATAAATGNLKAAQTVTTLTNAATLAAAPNEAVKNPATTVDAAQTVKETTGLVQSTINTIKSWFSTPTPPPAPKPPPPPNCSVAGACSK